VFLGTIFAFILLSSLHQKQQQKYIKQKNQLKKLVASACFRHEGVALENLLYAILNF